MPRQETIVKIKPEVLKWTIDSSGWENEELAKKLNISSETLENWKSKNVGIEIKKLEKLSGFVKRPLAIFFLQSPPTESELTDYRKLPKDDTVKLTSSTMLSIRNARYLQSVAQELLKLQGIDPKPKVNKKITLKNSPEAIAKMERKKLGFESEDVLLSKEARKSVRDFYNVLRRQIESLNVFVFQGSMSIREVRGLTLSDKYPRVIVVNSKDSHQARIFSLLHEYGHILLRKDGMCIPKAVFEQSNFDDTQRIESWCNRFAASVLMPKQQFLEELTKLEQKEENLKNIIILLATKFRTSKQATTIRLKTLTKNNIPINEFQKIYSEFENEPKKQSPKKKSKGGPSATDICISRKGRKFVSLVIDSKQSKNIINSDVIEYLNLNLKHLKKLQEKVQ